MRRLFDLSFLALAGGLVSALPAAAQQGFALKGHYIVNESAAQEARESQRIPGADAFGLGAELVLPFGLGVGVSGYAASEEGFEVETTELTVLAEANYFLRLPLLPLAPYAGVHAGLGRLSRDNASDPDLELQDRNRSQLGYQVGLRFQASPLLGLDAQWRRMSTSAAEGQGGRLERSQILLGVTLF